MNFSPDFDTPFSPPGLTVQEMLALKRTPLGLLTQRRCPPALVGDIAARLQLLAMQPETTSARLEAAAAWECQWWGLRVVAIKVIACWGGPENLAWLAQRAEQPRPPIQAREDSWWNIETTAAAGARWACGRMLHSSVPAEHDSETLLPVSTSNNFGRWMHIFGMEPSPALLAALPDTSVMALLLRISQEARGPAREQLALIMANRETLPGRMMILQSLAEGQDKAAELARTIIADCRMHGTPLMTAATFRSIADVLYWDGINWEPYMLGELIGASVRTIMLWHNGEASVPDHVARWLYGQINAHLSASPR